MFSHTTSGKKKKKIHFQTTVIVKSMGNEYHIMHIDNMDTLLKLLKNSFDCYLLHLNILFFY